MSKQLNGMLLMTISVILSAELGQSCYLGIANCMEGLVKRSGNAADSELFMQQNTPSSIQNQVDRICPACGPSGTGICYGPKVCCGHFGCFISDMAPSLAPCRAESEVVGSGNCVVPGVSCGAYGTCSTNGFCCSSNGCVQDNECQMNSYMKHP